MLSNNERRILDEMEADLTCGPTRRRARRASVRRGASRLLTIVALVVVLGLCASVSVPRPIGAALIALSAAVLGATLATMLHQRLLTVRWWLSRRRDWRRP